MEDKNGSKNNNKEAEVKQDATKTSDVTKNTAPNPKENSSDAKNKDTFQDYVAEFKKIVWPSRPEVFKKTTTVVTMSLFVGVIIFGMDTLLSTSYTASLRAIRDDIPDLTTDYSDMEFTDEMMQEMINEGIMMQTEDGLQPLDENSITITPSSDSIQVLDGDGNVLETEVTPDGTIVSGEEATIEGEDVTITDGLVSDEIISDETIATTEEVANPLGETVETEPVQTELVQTELVQTEPVQTETVDVVSSED